MVGRVRNVRRAPRGAVPDVSWGVEGRGCPGLVRRRVRSVHSNPPDGDNTGRYAHFPHAHAERAPKVIAELGQRSERATECFRGSEMGLDWRPPSWCASAGLCAALAEIDHCGGVGLLRQRLE